MSAIEYLMSGGMASTGGDIPDAEQKNCNEFIKKFGNSVSKIARSFQIPASQISLFKMNFLFVGKDTSNFHFLFVDKAGGNQINYKDLSNYGKLSSQELIHQIRIEVGEVHWNLTVPVPTLSKITEEKVEELASQYINAILESMKQKRYLMTQLQIQK
jgi:hypothetical protein